MQEIDEAIAALLKAVSAFLCAFNSAVVDSLPSDAAYALLELIATDARGNLMLATLNAHAAAARDACTQWERTDQPINSVAREAVRAASEAVPEGIPKRFECGGFCKALKREYQSSGINGWSARTYDG